MKAPRAALTGLISLCAMACALLLASVPAQAAEEVHPYLASQSLTGFPDGQGGGVTVDSHGDVYVSVPLQEKVEVFSPAGSKLTEFKTVKVTGHGPGGIAIASNGDAYVQEFNSQVLKYKPSVFPPTVSTTYALDESAGEKGVIVPKSANAHGIAIDPANQDLYVAETSHIASYEPNGTLISGTIGEGLVPEPHYFGVAVYGANGDLYVTDANNLKAYVLNPTGTMILTEVGDSSHPVCVSGEFTGEPCDLAVDQSDGDVYVFHCIFNQSETTSVVYEFNSAGGYLSTIGNKFGGVSFLQNSGPSAIAVDNGGASSPNNGDVYVTSKEETNGNKVYAFGPSTEYALEVKKSGAGGGTVTSEPAGIDCGPTCSARFTKGEKIKLTATKEAGSKFEGWSGGGCSGTAACEVTMSEAESVTATFGLGGPVEYALEVKDEGSGTVTSAPPGIDCGMTCSAEFPEGEVITLTAAEGSGYEFTGWSECTPLPNPKQCEVTMSAAKTVTATFGVKAKPKFALHVNTVGTGIVTSIEPAGAINCGSTCEASLEEGVEVELQTVAGTGYEFAGWSGSGCSGIGTCKLTMSEAHTVTATFNTKAKPKYALKVSKTGTGAGAVMSEPLGIDCGLTCEAGYEQGVEVELMANAEPGSTFAGWSGGGCSGTGVCEVTMTEAKSVTAEFAATPVYTLSVEKSGTGTGTVVTTKPSGSTIDCGGTCDASLEEGTEVELEAKAEAGSTFEGWSGGGCSGTGACRVTLSAATTVTAAFTQNTPTTTTTTPTTTTTTPSATTPATTPTTSTTPTTTTPTPASEGRLTVPAVASVAHGGALLKLSCTATGPCVGRLTLTVKVRQGHKTKTVQIGQASYSLLAGQSQTVKIALSAAAVKLLRHHGSVVATLTGTGVNRTVKLNTSKGRR